MSEPGERRFRSVEEVLAEQKAEAEKRVGVPVVEEAGLRTAGVRAGLVVVAVLSVVIVLAAERIIYDIGSPTETRAGWSHRTRDDLAGLASGSLCLWVWILVLPILGAARRSPEDAYLQGFASGARTAALALIPISLVYNGLGTLLSHARL